MVRYKEEHGPEYKARLIEEYLWQIDPRLRAVILDADHMVNSTFGLDLIITCLIRSVEENKAANGFKYSAHLPGYYMADRGCESFISCRGRGVDFRTHNLPRKAVEGLIEYLSLTWGEFLFIKWHDSGSGKHLHVNIRFKYRRN